MISTDSAIVIRVDGIPAPQGSKSYKGMTRRGFPRLAESSKHVGPWRGMVSLATAAVYKGEPLTCAVRVEIDFYFPRPKGHFSTAKGKENVVLPSKPTRCTSSRHGDLDKLCRSTLDALAYKSGGRVIHDDSLVVELVARKHYADIQPPGALVSVIPLR